MISGLEFHQIIHNIFQDVKGYNESEQIQVNCPMCQERDFLDEPDGKYNLEINTQKRVFRCWKCDDPKFSGSLGRLVRTFGTSTDYELYKSYSGEFFDYQHTDGDGELQHVQLPDEFISFSKIIPTNTDHMEAYNYLIFDRKLTLDTLLKYRLGFCVDGKYGGRIIIPSYDVEGELNYFVGRTYKKDKYGKDLKPTYLNPKVDKDTIIFNEGMINWDSTLYVCEGVFEFLSFPTNITPMLGKNLPNALFYMLKIKKPPVVIILDPDAYKEAMKIFQILSAIYVGEEDKIKIVKLSGDSDLDEIRRKGGEKEVIRMLYTARQLIDDDYFLFKKYTNENVKTKSRFRTYNQNKIW